MWVDFKCWLFESKNNIISIMQDMTYPFEDWLFHLDDFQSVFEGKF